MGSSVSDLMSTKPSSDSTKNTTNTSKNSKANTNETSANCNQCAKYTDMPFALRFPPNKTPVVPVAGAQVNNFTTEVVINVSLAKVGNLVCMYMPPHANTLLDTNNAGCIYETQTGNFPNAYLPPHTLTLPLVNNNCGVQTVGTLLIYGKDSTAKGTLRFYGGQNQSRYRCEGTTDNGLKSHGPMGSSFTWLTDTTN